MDIKFKKLQPQADSTGETASGGWSKVVGWLKNNSGDRAETYFSPLFDDEEKCDLIVVHIDADIHQDLLANAGRDKLPEPISVQELVDTVTDVLISWFSVKPERENFVAYAVPVFKTENWIMASVVECPPEKWTAADAKRELRTLFDASQYKSVVTMKASYVQALASDSTGALRAKSYSIFAQRLYSIASGLSA